MLYFYDNGSSKAIVFIKNFKINESAILYKFISGCKVPNKWQIIHKTYYKPITDEKKLELL